MQTRYTNSGSLGVALGRRDDSVLELGRAEIRRGSEEERRVDQQHVGPFAAVGEPEGPAQTNACGLIERRITKKVYLFYGTIGQKWASSRTLAGLERKGELENRNWGLQRTPLRFRSMESEE